MPPCLAHSFFQKPQYRFVPVLSPHATCLLTDPGTSSWSPDGVAAPSHTLFNGIDLSVSSLSHLYKLNPESSQNTANEFLISVPMFFTSKISIWLLFIFYKSLVRCSIFFIQLESICNCLLEHFYNSSFKIPVS